MTLTQLWKDNDDENVFLENSNTNKQKNAVCRNQDTAQIPIAKIVTPKGRQLDFMKVIEMIDLQLDNLQSSKERKIESSHQEIIAKRIIENHCKLKDFVRMQKDMILSSIEDDQSKTHVLLVLNYIDHVFLQNVDP